MTCAAARVQGVDESVVTEYIIRMLGLDVCADTKVGNQMIRGISGGQKKRVTSGEMLVSAKRVRAPLLAVWRRQRRAPHGVSRTKLVFDGQVNL